MESLLGLLPLLLDCRDRKVFDGELVTTVAPVTSDHLCTYLTSYEFPLVDFVLLRISRQGTPELTSTKYTYSFLNLLYTVDRSL